MAVVSLGAAGAFAGPRVEIEPNGTFPGVAPSGGSTLVSGGTIQGTITPGDIDYIRVTVPAISPAPEGQPTISRRVFEVAANGDVAIDLIEPSTGRVLASSDDVADGVSGGGPGSARCVFELVEATPGQTEWTLAVRGFWKDAQFAYEVRYAAVSTPPPVAVTLPPFTPTFWVDSVGPADSRWYAINLIETGWLKVTVTPDVPFPADCAFAVLNASGEVVGYADDIYDASIEFWQSSNDSLSGTMYLVVAPASMRTAFGTPLPPPGPNPPPLLWNRNGVGLGELVGWEFVASQGGFTRVPSGTFRVDVEHGTPPEPCTADYDMNGGVDGGDLGAFLGDFEAGEARADLDANGGIDGGDLSTFFFHFESGC